MCKGAPLFYGAFFLGEAIFQVGCCCRLLCPPGRSVLARGSGSTAAYASQTRFAMQEGSYAFLD